MKIKEQRWYYRPNRDEGEDKHNYQKAKKRRSVKSPLKINPLKNNIRFKIDITEYFKDLIQ